MVPCRQDSLHSLCKAVQTDKKFLTIIIPPRNPNQVMKKYLFNYFQATIITVAFVKNIVLTKSLEKITTVCKIYSPFYKDATSLHHSNYFSDFTHKSPQNYLPKLNLNLTSPILSERHKTPNFNRLIVSCSNLHAQNVTRCDENLCLQTLSRFCHRPLALFFFFTHVFQSMECTLG